LVYQIRSSEHKTQSPFLSEGEAPEGLLRVGLFERPEQIPLGGDRQSVKTLAIEEGPDKKALRGRAHGPVHKKGKTDSSGSFILAEKGWKKVGRGGFPFHEGAKMSQVARAVRGKESVDLSPEDQANPVPQVRRIGVCRILSVGQAREVQCLADFLATEGQEGTENPSTAGRSDSDQGAGTAPPEEVGQNRFDPVVELVSQKESRTGMRAEKVFEKNVPFLPQDRFGDAGAGEFG
jgi:hypothetical protein